MHKDKQQDEKRQTDAVCTYTVGNCLFNDVNAVLTHIMKACRGLEVQLHSFLISALDGAEW